MKRKPITMTTAPIVLAHKEANTQEGKRGFRIRAYTGAIIDSYFGRMVFDISGMSSPDSVPILREHERDRIVGFAAKGRRKENAFVIDGMFSDVTPDGQQCMALADEGFPWQASIGVWPVKIRQVSQEESVEVNGQTIKGPIEVWTKSNVREVSFVALGADSNTSVAVLSANGDAMEVEVEIEKTKAQSTEPQKQQKEKTPMTKEELMAAEPVLASALTDDGVMRERDRVLQILAADSEGRHRGVVLKAIEAGTPADGVFRALYEAEIAAKKTGLQQMASAATAPTGQTRGEVDEKTFEGEVELAMQRGQLSRAEAIRRVAASSPELHRAYLKRINP